MHPDAMGIKRLINKGFERVECSWNELAQLVLTVENCNVRGCIDHYNLF